MTLPRIKLVDRELVADGTMAFSFEKPEGFEYRAGQFADYTLIDPPEVARASDTRGFTLSSAPYEPYLTATTRLRDSGFKSTLAAVPLDTEVLLDAPYGSFTLPHDTTRPAVFLAGGIGVTPVRSIALQAAYDRTGHHITAFYSNHRPEEAAFLDELTALSEKEDGFTLVATMTAPETSRKQWSGETGYIDAAMLGRHVDDLAAPVYYLCGPATMVKALRGALTDAGIDDDDIRTEEFTGY
jgi:ferredoxin-NADP reductase